MAWNTSGPARLGSDNVLRFSSADHFLRELSGNLGRGRAFVQTRRAFPLQTTLNLRIEAPGVAWGINAEAIVVFARDGFIGLEFEDFESSVLPKLDMLGEELVKSSAAPEAVDAVERTLIAPMPMNDAALEELGRNDGVEHGADLSADPWTTGDSAIGSVIDTDTPNDEERTGKMPVSPEFISSLDEHEEREVPDPAEEAPKMLRTTRSPSGARIRHVEAATMRLEDASDHHLIRPPDRANTELRKGPPPKPEIAGVDTLEDRAVFLWRASSAGVVRATDMSSLLGLYLSEIRHGHVTLFGGPEGEVGAPVKLKIAAGHVTSVDATIAARVGSWVTLAIQDPSPILDLLTETRDSWISVIDGIGGEEALVVAAELEPAEELHPHAASIARTDSLSARDPGPTTHPSVAVHAAGQKQDHSDLFLEPVSTPTRTPANGSQAELTRAPSAPVTPPPPPPPPPLQHEPPSGATVQALPAQPAHDAGPPKVAQLQGDTVGFPRASDLLHELETNLKNGGLLVDAPPLPLRTRRTLKISVGGVQTGVSIEADVVFASGGRVGFSVMNPQDAKVRLTRSLEALAASPNRDGPQGQAPATASHPPSQPMAALDNTLTPLTPIRTPVPGDTSIPSIPAFTGRILPPWAIGDLLDFQNKRPRSIGDLTNAAVLPLVEFICRQGGRGVLTVKSGAARLVIYFHEGNVAYVEASPFDEATSLGRILIAGKKLNDSALREGLDRAKQMKRPLGRVLVSLGSITKKVLADALREQSRTRIDQAFTWKDGTFEWGPWREPPGDADLVLTKGFGIFARYVRSCFETLSTSEVEAALGRNFGRVVIARDDVDVLATVIGLQQKDLRFIELSLAGERTISDAVTGSPIGRLASLRLVAAGLSIGLLLYKDGRPVPQTGAMPIRSSSEMESPTTARIKRELKDRLTLLKSMNHFEVLGVHWSAHYRSYRAAHEKTRSEFSLTKPPLRDAPIDVQETARELLRIIDHAYNTLADEAQRIGYRKQLFDKTERQYSADMLVKQGEVALMRGDRVGAMEALETAVELDPSARNRSLLASAREGKA